MDQQDSQDRIRLDRYLVEKMGVRSRSLAAELIELGVIRVSEGSQNLKARPSLKIGPRHQVFMDEHPLNQKVSRSALKLEGALQELQISLVDQVVLDVGQSTGGFTQVALDFGAERVIGVDVGHDQLDPSLKDNPKVQGFERVNAKDLSEEWLRENTGLHRVDQVVMDVSFISITQVLPRLSVLSSQVLSLVKPQFELSAKQLGKGGIVNDESLYAEVENKIRLCATDLGFEVLDYIESPITGRDGNREFFVRLRALV